MKKINSNAKLSIALTLFLSLIPMITSFTVLNDNPRVKVEVPSNINISQAEIFDGMVVNYTFDYSGIVHNTSFIYEYDSGNNYNVTWWFSSGGTSTWVEDETNRLISLPNGPYAFSSGSHALAWIFTNVSLYDLVQIAVDGVGDHIFNITKEKIFNIPGFGSVEVWQLEDLSFPGGIAWYEKSTGILIKGYFLWGASDYALEFVDSNVMFNYVTPVSGLFDGLYMIYDWAGILTMNTSYSGYSVNTYNLTMDVSPLGTGYWNEDTTTRIMSNVNPASPNFLPGVYTLFWIFTNVSLGTPVKITVDGEGDHDFQVTSSINLEYPGFGPISVWQLEDLDGFGGTVWYEKNSGILLNGTFVYSGGSANYTINILDTNANFGYLLPYAFTLSTNATDPDIDGIFDFEWTESIFAEDYSIYEYSSYITEINGSLTPIASDTTNMTKHLSGYSTGDYYFIAVANNIAGSTLSNCIQVTVTIPSPGGIPGYSVFFLLLATLSVSMIMIKKWKIVHISK